MFYDPKQSSPPFIAYRCCALHHCQRERHHHHHQNHTHRYPQADQTITSLINKQVKFYSFFGKTKPQDENKAFLCVVRTQNMPTMHHEVNF